MGYYCGIDMGSKESSICVMDSRRQVLLEDKIETTAAGLRKALKRYKRMECIVEAAPLAEWLCTEVEKHGHKITIVCPRKAKAALSGRGSKKKTDKRDARGLAELCHSGWYEPVHRKSTEAREMRSYLTARKQLVECSTAIASSIRGILRAHGIKLATRTDEPDFEMEVRAALKELPALAQRGIEELLSAFQQLHGQQRKLYRDLNKHAKNDEITALLMTHPGVGPATAAAFVATIDDPSRFSDAEKVTAYIGLTPSVYQSGETEYRGRITKTGDRLLRWLLVEAANNLLTRSKSDCGLKRWGLALEEKKGVGKARVAVARKLCATLWRMWEDNQTFNPEAMAA